MSDPEKSLKFYFGDKEIGPDESITYTGHADLIAGIALEDLKAGDLLAMDAKTGRVIRWPSPS